LASLRAILTLPLAAVYVSVSAAKAAIFNAIVLRPLPTFEG
jgi:hypothetical protein